MKILGKQTHHLALLTLGMSLLLLTSCKEGVEDDGRIWGSVEELRYIVPSYFTPHQESSSLEHQYPRYWELVLRAKYNEHISSNNGFPGEKYKTLALEHYEKGEKVFKLNSSIVVNSESLTTGVKKIEVFLKKNGEKDFIDVSSYYRITYGCSKDYILSGYKDFDDIGRKYRKNIAQLSKEDLLWIPEVSDIYCEDTIFGLNEVGDTLKLVITLREADPVVLTSTLEKKES